MKKTTEEALFKLPDSVKSYGLKQAYDYYVYKNPDKYLTYDEYYYIWRVFGYTVSDHLVQEGNSYVLPLDLGTIEAKRSYAKDKDAEELKKFLFRIERLKRRPLAKELLSKLITQEKFIEIKFSHTLPLLVKESHYYSNNHLPIIYKRSDYMLRQGFLKGQLGEKYHKYNV
jgi:hypothetical protein